MSQWGRDTLKSAMRAVGVDGVLVSSRADGSLLVEMFGGGYAVAPTLPDRLAIANRIQKVLNDCLKPPKRERRRKTEAKKRKAA
jgi:hypothetical protein